jgi:hypothetical protein
MMQFFSGVLVTGYAIAGLFFLRFWRASHDRLFGYFASAFFVLAIQRILIATSEPTTAVYVVRLLAFVLILWGIVDKNRRPA